MASTVKKLEELNPDDFISSGRQCRISDKHYRPYHHQLQKQQRLADNDWIDYYSMSGSPSKDWDAGINKLKWKAHETDCFDEYKDDY